MNGDLIFSRRGLRIWFTGKTYKVATLHDEVRLQAVDVENLINQLIKHRSKDRQVYFSDASS